MRNKKIYFVFLGFIFAYILIIISLQDIINSVNTTYSRSLLMSNFKSMVTDEELEFSNFIEEEKIEAFANKNMPYLQNIDGDYLALGLIATNSTDINSYKNFNIKGEIFSKTDIANGENKVIIPNHLEKYCKNKDGKNYIYIESLDSDFEVIGIMENKGMYRDVLIPYKNIENIKNGEYTFMVDKFKNIDLKTYNNFQDNSKPSLLNIIKFELQSYKSVFINMFLGIGLAFCSMVIFTILWIDENKKIFKIFRLLGCSGKYIFCYAFKRIFIIAILSMVLTIIIGNFIELLYGIVNFKIAIALIPICGIFSTVISLVVTIISLKNTLLFVPKEGR